MHLAVWTPLPPSSSGIADYAYEQLEVLSKRARLSAVVEDKMGVAAPPGVALATPEDPPEADLHLYQLGNSPPHAYVYRAALARPGVAVLHEWSLHHLVLRETVERGDVGSYLHEMRRGYGERGTFVARQVARALGGSILPALFPLNDRILEASFGIVGLTRFIVEHAQSRLPGRPILHLPHHVAVAPSDPLPSRLEARRQLGLKEDALVVTAPGLATSSKRLEVALRALGRLKNPSLRVVIAGEVEPGLPLTKWVEAAHLESAIVVTGRLGLTDFVRHLVAADVVLALRFPSHGEISGALLRALAVGRACLVTAGTPAQEEFPDGVVVPIDPGPREEAELEAFLSRLLVDPPLRDAIGEAAREHVLKEHSLPKEADSLLAFLETVLSRKEELQASFAKDGIPEGTLLGYLMEEVRWGARDLGMPGLSLSLKPLLEELADES